MKLYELAEEVRAQLELIEDAEDSQAALSTLQGLQGALEHRVEWVGLRVLEMGHELSGLDAEIQRLRDAKATMERQRDWLKVYLGIVLARADMKRVDGNLCKVRRQKSPPSVVVSVDLAKAQETGEDLRVLLDPRFVRVIPERTEIDKKGIMENFKATGELPDGVEIDETRESVVVW